MMWFLCRTYTVYHVTIYGYLGTVAKYSIESSIYWTLLLKTTRSRVKLTLHLLTFSSSSLFCFSRKMQSGWYSLTSWIHFHNLHHHRRLNVRICRWILFYFFLLLSRFGMCFGLPSKTAKVRRFPLSPIYNFSQGIFFYFFLSPTLFSHPSSLSHYKQEKIFLSQKNYSPPFFFPFSFSFSFSFNIFFFPSTPAQRRSQV